MRFCFKVHARAAVPEEYPRPVLFGRVRKDLVTVIIKEEGKQFGVCCHD